MQETQRLKLLYEDDDGLVYVNLFDDGKLVIHSHIKKEVTKELLEKARNVSMMVDQMCKEKGVKYLHTWATSPEEERYNGFLGYTPTGYDVEIEGYEGPPITEYYKEL